MRHLSRTTLLVLGIIFLAGGISARDHQWFAPRNFLTVTGFVNPAGLGLKHLIGRNFYATGTLEYMKSEADLNLRFGAAYLIPAHLLFFRFYGGAGIQVSRNDFYQYPYMSVGTHFLFLYSEVIYPLKSHRDPQYRFGFNVKF